MISILPPAVADQIAAGEVVERPSSVIKELLENALDAGASVVDIAVEEGGRRLIRVSDDGSGISADDLPRALARHGTSKIRSASDLVGVATFGFRGEALPSIASVSRFSIEASAGEERGSRMTSAGGKLSAPEEISRQRGTTVTVEQLFYNVPARLKFLRSARSEWRSAVEVITSLALTHPEVRITVEHDGREVLTLPPVSGMRARIAGVWGGKYAEALLDVTDRTPLLLAVAFRADGSTEGSRFRLHALEHYAHRVVELALGPLSDAAGEELLAMLMPEGLDQGVASQG